MAFSQMQTMEVNNNAEFNKLEGLSKQLGGHVEDALQPVPTP